MASRNYYVDGYFDNPVEKESCGSGGIFLTGVVAGVLGIAFLALIARSKLSK